MPNKFWELFGKNVIISGCLALMLGGTTCYMAITGQQVPEVLVLGLGTVLGYFFGSGKAQATVQTFSTKAQ